MTDLAARPTSFVRRPLAESWPLVGRDEALEGVVADLLGAAVRAVVVGGVAGVGKTRVLTEVIARARDEGVVVAKVAASRSASSIPFGAIAPLLPVEELLAESVIGVLHRAARVIADIGGGRRVLMVVDDAHLLDDATATLIHQLVLDGSVLLLLSIRQGEQFSAPLVAVVNDPSSITVELRELDRADVERLTTHVLGADVDGAAVQSLLDISRGNPLYLRELLAAFVEGGTLELRGGMWSLIGKVAMPARLLELIEERLATVTDEERVALELLAVGHAVGRAALEEVVGPAAVARLVRRGLVVSASDGSRAPLQLHHPLYEEALRGKLSSRRLRAAQLQLADLIEQHGARRREDRLQMTTLRLEAGGRLDLALLEAAAVDAYFALNVELCERLARAGVTAGAGPRLRRLLGEVLRWQGRHEEAEAIFSATSLRGVEQVERVLTALMRAENLFRGLGETEAAARILQDAHAVTTDVSLRDELTAMEAVFSALAGDVRTAVAAASSVLERAHPRASSVAATAATAALTFSGRSEDAIATAVAAFSQASELPPQEGLAVPATHVIGRCLGLIEAGRLEEGEMFGRIAYEWSLVGGNKQGQGWFALLLARGAQTGGRLDEAARRFRESALIWLDLRDHGLRRWALTGLAQTLAASGRHAEAAMTLDELDMAPSSAVRLLEAEVLRARAWVAFARRGNSEGRRLLLDAADWAASRGQHGLELTMLHDLVRTGDTRAAAERAAALGPRLQGPLAAARGSHAAAARAQDGFLLDEAAAAFAAIGANLFAAEAAAQAGSAHRQAGRSSSASASEASSAALTSLCDGALTPGTRRGGDVLASRLTPRELELASLAASGSSSAAIAAQLGISVRTVSNLLQRAYVKLGISGRRELPERLAQL